jgi:type VI secretion system (T6SS) effector TldE1-like protein
VKLRWIFTGLAATVAILAIGFVLSAREQRGVAAAMPAAAPSARTTVLQIVRPAARLAEPAQTRPAKAAQAGGLSFADRFAGAPLWETAYGAARTEARTAVAYASAQAPSPARRAIDAVEAVASRAPAYALASASESVAIPSEARPRPVTIASAVAAFSEPDSKIAIYDIAAHTVYMPNGDTLEAHSGLGERLDNPRFVNVKMKGPTPPNVYKMSLRERAFHGVRAIRLNPVDESKMFGRDGMLAHTYMLRNRGHSNGCVVFSNYPAFLAAFQRGEVDRLVVVEHLDRKPVPSSRIASASP